MSMLVLHYISYLVLLMFILMSVAFYTLLERKILGYMQLRSGPNSVSIGGILQPIADGVKLFLSEDIIPSSTYRLLYWLSPVLGLLIMMVFIQLFPFISLKGDEKLSVLLFLCVSSLGVYSVILAGWSSSSKYANLGSYRAVAQAISYEVNMSFIILGSVLYFESLAFVDLGLWGWEYYVVYLVYILIWLNVILAETNRSPYDLPEAESELVSGYNTDYSGGGFALIFITEYGNIIMMSLVTSYLFWGGCLWGGLFIMIFFLWVRATFPRFRYDYLMYVSWKMYLPLVLGLFFLLVAYYFIGF